MLKHDWALYSAHRLMLHQYDNDPLSVVTRLFTPLFIRDRFDILNDYSPFRVAKGADVLPTPFTDEVLMLDIIEKRAEELIEKADSKDIVVCWSGGIDSTTALVAFMKALPESEHHRIHVVGTDMSIAEHPDMYRKLQTSKVQITITDDVTDTLSDIDCGIIVSGWCGDQLFGSDIHLRVQGMYNSNWVDGLQHAHTTINKSPLSKKSLELLEGVYKDYATKLGVELEQFCDFAWLINFGIKYSHIRDNQLLRLLGTPNAEKTIAFFDSFDFQRYSVTHYKARRLHNGYMEHRRFKQELRNYIYAYTGDAKYFATKGKIGSWMTASSPLHSIRCNTDAGVKNFTHKEQPECGHCLTALEAAINKSFRKEGRWHEV